MDICSAERQRAAGDPQDLRYATSSIIPDMPLKPEKRDSVAYKIAVFCGAFCLVASTCSVTRLNIIKCLREENREGLELETCVRLR